MKSVRDLEKHGVIGLLLEGLREKKATLNEIVNIVADLIIAAADTVSSASKSTTITTLTKGRRKRGSSHSNERDFSSYLSCAEDAVNAIKFFFNLSLKKQFFL